jgi:hypothetical protein
MDNTEERRLWMGVLTCAVADSCNQIVGVRPGERHLVQDEARRWLDSESREVGSYLWVVDSLDIDPAYARRQIRRFSISATTRSKPRCFRAGASGKRTSRVHARPLELASAQAGY